MTYAFLCRQWRNAPFTYIVSSDSGTGRRAASARCWVKHGLLERRAGMPARTVRLAGYGKVKGSCRPVSVLPCGVTSCVCFHLLCDGRETPVNIVKSITNSGPVWRRRAGRFLGRRQGSKPRIRHGTRPLEVFPSGRSDGIEFFDFGWREFPLRGSDVLSDLILRTGPGDDRTHLRIGQQPRDRQFEGRMAPRFGKLL